MALDAITRREHFTAATDLVFCTVTGGRLTGDAIRDAFYDALTAAGLAHLRYLEPPTDHTPGVLREYPIIPTTCATPSARWRCAQRRCPTCKRGWAISTSRPPCAASTTGPSTTPQPSSPPPSPPNPCTQPCTEQGSCTRK
ncbi:MAG TPA: hypothetical protein VLK59_09445 [Solirubrobacteraceae bacterium]|nr:hypothetical protein [Solirubrobacteraceae bacterium]